MTRYFDIRPGRIVTETFEEFRQRRAMGNRLLARHFGGRLAIENDPLWERLPRRVLPVAVEAACETIGAEWRRGRRG